MKRSLGIIILFITYFQCIAQLKVPVKIDTSKKEVMQQYKFIKAYLAQDTINNEFWHPKYKNKEVYNYTIDWLWGSRTPKKISKMFNLELVELQQVNDTLAYFKLAAHSKPDSLNSIYTNVYKYNIVKVNGKYYLDNCKPYDALRFKKYSTKYLTFYVSPFYNIELKAMEKANEDLEKLYQHLKKPALKQPLEYYMCATEEELNNLSNIVIWDGGLGAYTNIPDGFIVGINKNPVYKHEFVHAILGPSAYCYFMQEGIAVLFGGMDKGAKSYEDGIIDLKACYKSGRCNFDNLYKQELKQQYNSNLTYTFAAAFCKYLIDLYGLEYFYKLYYDKEINTGNFMEKVAEKTGKTKAEIIKGVEGIILAGK